MNQATINVFEPSLGKLELAALKSVFKRKWPGRGEEVEKFEAEFASYLKVPRNEIVSTNSCTEAIFQILESLDNDKNEIIIPTNSFIGVANAIVATGRKIVFCDIDPTTGNAKPEAIKEKISQNTLAVIFQHYGGLPAETEAIVQLCRDFNVISIEDSAGALGSQSHSQPCGTLGDYSIWSFDAMKMVVAGDGGMIRGKPEKVSELRARMYMGLESVTGFSKMQNNNRWWEFEISYPGRRSIMNDMTAAVGRVQLSKLDRNIKRRAKNAAYYTKNIKNTDIQFLTSYKYTKLNNYFFPILVLNGKRDSLAKSLKEKNIYSTFRYYPLNKVKYFQSETERFPGTEKFAAELLLLPQHANLKGRDLARIVNSINDFE